MRIREDLVDTSRYARKCPYEMTPRFVVIHNTYNDASADAEISYMKRNDNEVSFHYAVDDREAVRGIPENRNAWHAGDGAGGRGNRYGIAIEICYSKSGGPRFDQAEANGAALAAQILQRYGWGIEKVCKHQDFSGKYCPHRTLDRGWPRFLALVRDCLQQLAGEPPVAPRGYAVGDAVAVTGYPCATAAGERPGKLLERYRGTVTRVHDSGTHRYHIDAKGWCRAEDLTPLLGQNPQTELRAGSKVRVLPGASHYATGQRIPDWVKGREDVIVQCEGDRALLQGIYSWVYLSDLEPDG